MDDAGLNQNVQEQAQAVDERHHDGISNDYKHLDPTRWWIASAAFPMIAGTLGPVASAFSICSLVESWRQTIPPGSNIFNAQFVKDPAWLIVVNAVQLAVAVIANLFLLLNMTKRVRFSVAQPVTIVGWYLSAICLIALTATAGGPLILEDGDEWIWSQAFYYAVYSAVLYFIVASLMTVTVWGAYAGHYGKDFELTMSQRTLMLQTLAFLVYLLVGSLVFSTIEDWEYLDGVYWADATLFTVGYGDISPQTTLGRALLIPYALIGITSLGLVIGSIRSLMLDRGRRKLDVRMLEKKRKQLLRRITQRGEDGILEPIRNDDVEGAPSSKEGPSNSPQTEFERRKTEFALMRKIQDKASVRRRWSAMAISTSTWLVLWLVGAKIFETCEAPYQGWGYFDGVYFAYTGLTTIGYGDYVPVSNGGKSFFVFWSLLALPTMTVFISNSGDTVVKLIRDGTLKLGNITILPGDVSIAKEIKQLLAKLSRGHLFEDDEEIEESPPGFLGAAQPRKEGEGDDDDDGEGEEGDEDSPPSTGNTDSTRGGAKMRSSGTDPMGKIQQKPRQKQRKRSMSPLGVPTELPKSRPEFHLLLIEEITRVTEHLKSSPPRKYSFKEWAWYLRLIGEDEGSTETHQKVMRKSRDENRHGNRATHEQPGPSTKYRPQPLAVGDERQEGEKADSSSSASKWSWVGHRSPLMDTREEAEWILDRLQRKLKGELQSVVREQQGEDGFERVRSEERSNEERPLEVSPMQ